ITLFALSILYRQFTCYSFSYPFFYNATAPTNIYTLSLHDALPIYQERSRKVAARTEEKHRRPQQQRQDDRTLSRRRPQADVPYRSEEHTSELQSRFDLVCRLLLEKKKTKTVKDNRKPKKQRRVLIE